MSEISVIKNDFLREQVIKATHRSGLSVYLVQKDFTSSYAMFGTRYGSYDNVFELDNERVEVPQGIAHFLEHKLFETEDGRDSFELFSELGADANAYTSTDRTAYLFFCTENFLQALDVLACMVLTPVFTDKNVAKEQGIIGQEIKMCEDRTANILHYNLMECMYEKNPVRIPIAGTIESISKITPSLLYKCYNAFYRMNNMALCVCADVEIEQILEILDRYLPEKQEESVSFASFDEADKVFNPCKETSAQVAKPLFEIGIKLSRENAQDKFCCDIVCEAVLGESEDFFASCFESELVSSYHYYIENGRTASYMQLGGDSDEPMSVLSAFKEHMARIRENGLDRAAFERAKRKMYSDCVQKFNDSEGIAEELFEAFLEHENMLDCAKGYADVSYEKACALAKAVFKDESLAISIIRPKGN